MSASERPDPRSKQKPSLGKSGLRGKETLYGRHALYEVLRADRRQVRRLIVAKGAKESGTLQQVLKLARTREIPVMQIERSELDLLCAGHQGVIAETSSFPYVTMDDILEQAKNDGQLPLVLLLDVLQDPQNMGTLMRTALAVGVHGVILPPRRGVGVTPGVVAASAGTCEHMLVAVANIAQSIRLLKKENLWVVGLENSAQAQTMGRMDMSGGLGLVIGGEAKGMRRLVRESCDALLRIPMRPGIDSLNAAVAGSIVLYAAWQARNFTGAHVPAS